MSCHSRHQYQALLCVCLLCVVYASNPVTIAPDTTLQAVVSERNVSLDEPNVLTVLIFHGEDTADAASEVNFAIRQAFPSASRVLIASVVDLGYVPEMFRGLARDAMRAAFHKEKDAYLPDGYSADDYIVILPDWEGDVTRAFGFHNVDETLGIVVLEERGRVLLAEQADHEHTDHEHTDDNDDNNQGDNNYSDHHDDNHDDNLGNDLADAAIETVRRQMMTALRPGAGW